MTYRVSVTFDIDVLDPVKLREQALATITQSMGADGHALGSEGVASGPEQTLDMAVAQFGDVAVLQFALAQGANAIPAALSGSVGGLANIHVGTPSKQTHQ